MLSDAFIRQKLTKIAQPLKTMYECKIDIFKNTTIKNLFIYFWSDLFFV